MLVFKVTEIHLADGKHLSDNVLVSLRSVLLGIKQALIHFALLVLAALHDQSGVLVSLSSDMKSGLVQHLSLDSLGCYRGILLPES